MILFPAIDLIGGKVVRLERGDRSRCKVYSDDPVAVARSFAEQGASWVHVVDLSAAFGEDEDACAANSAAIEAICGVDGLSVDVSGGVGTLEHFAEGVIEGEADAVLAASVFHFGTFSIREVKEYMASQGIPVRLDF